MCTLERGRRLVCGRNQDPETTCSKRSNDASTYPADGASGHGETHQGGTGHIVTDALSCYQVTAAAGDHMYFPAAFLQTDASLPGQLLPREISIR